MLLLFNLYCVMYEEGICIVYLFLIFVVLLSVIEDFIVVNVCLLSFLFD